MNATDSAGNFSLLAELPEVLTPPEVARVLRQGLNTTYELLRQGRIKGIRIGRKWKITKQSLLDFLQ